MTGIFDVLPALGAASAASASAGTLGMGALASGLGAVGASAATTGALTSMGASAAATLAGSSMSIGSLLTTALPLASAASAIFGGLQESKGITDAATASARALEMQSNEEILAAKQEELRGKQDTNAILDDLNKRLATNRLMATGSGIDPLSGTKSIIEDNTVQSADRALSTSRQDTILRSLTRRRQASEMLIQRGVSLRRGSSDSMTAALSGFASGANSIGNAYYREVNRG